MYPKLKHTFLYSNKTWDDIIFRDELARIERQHTDRVKVIHALTREEPLIGKANVRRGRIDATMLREAIPEPSACIVYACGPAISVWDKRAHAAKGTTPPPRFLETMQVYLGTLGVPRDRIKIEAFG